MDHKHIILSKSSTPWHSPWGIFTALIGEWEVCLREKWTSVIHTKRRCNAHTLSSQFLPVAELCGHSSALTLHHDGLTSLPIRVIRENQIVNSLVRHPSAISIECQLCSWKWGKAKELIFPEQFNTIWYFREHCNTCCPGERLMLFLSELLTRCAPFSIFTQEVDIPETQLFSVVTAHGGEWKAGFFLRWHLLLLTPACHSPAFLK